MAKHRFGDFIVSLDSRQIWLHGDEVHLSPKAFDLLGVLIVSYPKALSRTELQERVWPGVFVSDGNLPLLINEIRHALHDQAAPSRFIRTVRRFGYAFNAEVETIAEFGAPAPAGDCSCWLVWSDRPLPLKTGLNILGRRPGVDVLLDALGVSRAHARIVVRGDEVTIEDLGSKNGTFVDGARVDSVVRLRDRDRVQLGQAALEFRIASTSNRTETLTVRRGAEAS